MQLPAFPSRQALCSGQSCFGNEKVFKFRQRRKKSVVDKKQRQVSLDYHDAEKEELDLLPTKAGSRISVDLTADDRMGNKYIYRICSTL